MRGRIAVSLLASFCLIFLCSCEDTDPPGLHTSVEVHVKEYFSESPMPDVAFLVSALRGSPLHKYIYWQDTIWTDVDGITNYEFVNEANTSYELSHCACWEGWTSMLPLYWNDRKVWEGQSNSYNVTFKEKIPIEMRTKVKRDTSFNRLRISLQNIRLQSFGQYLFDDITHSFDTTLIFVGAREEEGFIITQYYDCEEKCDLKSTVRRSFNTGMADTARISVIL